MNCLHYSIPGTETIQNAIAHLPTGKTESAHLQSTDHFSCHRLLSQLARALENPYKDDEQKAESVEATEIIIEELSHDDRVRQSLGEYYGIRLLQAEARSAMAEYRNEGDTTGFDRLGSKLRRELEPNPIDETDQDPEASQPEFVLVPPQGSLLKSIGKVAGFIALLIAVIAGMLFTGAIAGGIGF